MKIYLFLFSLFIFNFNFGQEINFSEKEITITEQIDGTLTSPNNIEQPSLAIIIAGSGPTDRNGNQNFLKNDALKKLAEGLSTNGIATFRYDKRIVKQIRKGDVDEDMMFDDFVNDAKDVVSYFNEMDTYSKIYIIGHSQGSLVGMLAAEAHVDGFISLAGAGQNIGDVIIEQVTNMDPKLGEEAQSVVAQLKEGKVTKDYPAALVSVFGPQIQNFMINWMQYNPAEIISELNTSILIINGTKDLQVSVNEAEQLHTANSNSELKIIENMNHVLFIIEGDDLENSKSYNEAFRPISSELIDSITSFIKS